MLTLYAEYKKCAYNKLLTPIVLKKILLFPKNYSAMRSMKSAPPIACSPPPLPKSYWWDLRAKAISPCPGSKHQQNCPRENLTLPIISSLGFAVRTRHPDSKQKGTTVPPTLKRAPDCAFDLQAPVTSCPTRRTIHLLWPLAYTLYQRMALYPNCRSSSSDSLASICLLSEYPEIFFHFLLCKIITSQGRLVNSFFENLLPSIPQGYYPLDFHSFV